MKCIMNIRVSFLYLKTNLGTFKAPTKMAEFRRAKFKYQSSLAPIVDQHLFRHWVSKSDHKKLLKMTDDLKSKLTTTPQELDTLQNRVKILERWRLKRPGSMGLSPLPTWPLKRLCWRDCSVPQSFNLVNFRVLDPIDGGGVERKYTGDREVILFQ